MVARQKKRAAAAWPWLLQVASSIGAAVVVQRACKNGVAVSDVNAMVVARWEEASRSDVVWLMQVM